MRLLPYFRHASLLAAGLGVTLVALPASAQKDARQSGTAPSSADAPKVKRSAASPHPICKRDGSGKCVPSPATAKKSRQR